MNLSLTLQNVARQLPDRPALSWAEGGLSYAALKDQVQRIAGALLARHGLKPGMRVALAMENCPEYLPALYGIWRAGLAAVPMNSKLHPREMAWIVDNAEAKLCLASSKLAEDLSAPGLPADAMPPIIATGTRDYAALLSDEPMSNVPADAHDEAWLFYTSGTTGRPKGAMLTHRNLLFACAWLLRGHRFARARGLHPACGAAVARIRASMASPTSRAGRTTSSSPARSSRSACSRH